MIFEALSESLERGELWLRLGAMCRWHLRRDGQLTIKEVMVEPSQRRRGAATEIVRALSSVAGAKKLLARCPGDLPANAFWEAVGFVLMAKERTKSGRVVNVWLRDLSISTATAATNEPCKSPEMPDGSEAVEATTPSTPPHVL